MWRVPVSPPIPVYVREVGDEAQTYMRTHRTASVYYNAPVGAVQLELSCPVGFRIYLRQIIVNNTGGGPVNIDMTYFDRADYAYAFWNDTTGAVGNICILYGQNCDTGASSGVPVRWTRPLGIEMLYELERIELSMTTGAADTGQLTINYDLVKEFS